MRPPDSRISVRTKLFLLACVIILSVVAAQTAATIAAARKQNREHEEQNLAAQYYNLKDRIASLQKATAAIARSIAGRADVARMLAADNREGMLEFLLPVFASLKSSLEVSHLSIHNADGFVFLRLHRPEEYGDPILTFRPTITAAVMNQQVVAGIDFDRDYMTICGVAPIFNGDALIGLVDVVLDMDQAFIEDLKGHNQVDYKLWLTYEAARPSGMQPRRRPPPSPSPSLFLYSATYTQTLAIGRDLYERVMASGQPEFAFVRKGDQPVAVLLGPLLGHQNHIIGIAEITRSRAESLAALHQTQEMAIVIAVGLALVGLVLMWLLINLVIMRPLGHLSSVTRRQYEGDLEARAQALPADEFGLLGQRINSMVHKVGETLVEQKNTIAELRKTEETLRATESEYRRLYEDLQRREELYRSLLHSTPDAIIIYNLEGRVQYVNPAFSAIFKWSPEEVLGRRIPFVPDSEKETSLAIIMELIELGRPCNNFETRRLTKDGEILEVGISASRYDDHQGNPAGMLVVMRDITERKHAIESLRKSEEKYRNILENIEEGYFEVDLKGTFMFLNESLARNTGYPQDELVGTNFRKFTPQPVADQMFQLFNQVYRTGRNVKNAEMTVVRKDGQLRVGEISIARIVDQNDQAIGFRGIVRDVTQRTEAKREREMLEAQLRQAQKMEAIGTLAGGIAHDFNNILAPIMGYAELALGDLAVDSRLRKNLVPILNAAHRAKDLVQQILAFSRQSDQERKPLKVQPIIKEALKLLRSTLPTTIDIRLEVDADCGSIMADPTQIHQVIMNLCTNAYHAMREQGGILTVGLDEFEIGEDNRVAYPDLAPGRYLRLGVHDTGHGIDSQTMERIFEPYFTTKEKGEGTGMGLSVVHGIIKSHGGHITVASSPGQGARFDIYLPLLPLEGEEMAGQPVTPLETGTEHILVVDDEEVIAQVLENMLTRLGYEVTTRTGSVEALNVFQAHPERFDLVITDMTMPNMTGDRLAQSIRQTRSEIPIIVCSGFSEQLSQEKAKTLGIKGFIMKPVVIKDLARIVRRVLDG
jgi:PAS domain S-box-containing protein